MKCKFSNNKILLYCYNLLLQIIDCKIKYYCIAIIDFINLHLFT